MTTMCYAYCVGWRFWISGEVKGFYDMSEEPRIYCINGLKYKVGRFGMIFVWLNETWVKSTKSLSDLTTKRVSRFRDYGK